MNHKDRRLPFELVDATYPPAKHRIRQQAKIPASGHRQILSRHTRCRWREFNDLTGRAIDDIGESSGLGDSISVVVDREDGGIIAKPFFDQDLNRPQGLLHDGICRSAISLDGSPGNILEQQFCAPDIGAKVLWLLVEYELMVIAVACDFMSSAQNFTR